MIAGLPWDAWLLLAVAVGFGLGLELAFYRGRRRDRASGYAAGGIVEPDPGRPPAGGGEP